MFHNSLIFYEFMMSYLHPALACLGSLGRWLLSVCVCGGGLPKEPYCLVWWEADMCNMLVVPPKRRLLRWVLSQLLQQKEAVASLHREFASYKLTHSCSNAKYRKQMISQAILHQVGLVRIVLASWSKQ